MTVHPFIVSAGNAILAAKLLVFSHHNLREGYRESRDSFRESHECLRESVGSYHESGDSLRESGEGFRELEVGCLQFVFEPERFDLARHPIDWMKKQIALA